MSTQATPSTNWREIIAADEQTRFANYAELFAAMQRAKSERYGKGRALHRKQIVGLPANLEIFSDLPEHAHQGLFARPGRYDVLVRLSNGSASVTSDKVPNVRGFALKVRGVEGQGALGVPTTAQDFLLINREKFGLKNSKEFVGIAMAAAKSPLAIIGYLVKQHGLFGGLRKLKELQASQLQPFSGFATEAFYSAAPVACGKYAVHVRLVPKLTKPVMDSTEDLSVQMLATLEHTALQYDMQVQFFINEQQTPIEDGTVNWVESGAPCVSVARLTIPALKDWAAQKDRIQAEAENEIFDPWCALEEHRPLGDIMRARKVVYYESQKNRRA